MTSTQLSVEEAKEKAAERAVEEHFDPNSTFVGIGSGTTIGTRNDRLELYCGLKDS